jgi:molecular chaperone GrpE (heat shock protein)
VDVEETEQAAEGTVVEVYRAGYEWKGEVYRPAQVKVARKPTTASAGDHKNE